MLVFTQIRAWSVLLGNKNCRNKSMYVKYTADRVWLERLPCYSIWISDSKNCSFSGEGDEKSAGNIAAVGTKTDNVQLRWICIINKKIPSTRSLVRSHSVWRKNVNYFAISEGYRSLFVLRFALFYSVCVTHFQLRLYVSSWGKD